MSPIPSRIYNAAVGGHVCGPEDVDFGQKVVHLIKYDRAGNEVSFESQVTQSNKIYVIHDDFTLNGNIIMPANCVLKFDGGSLSGAYILTGDNTGIQAGLVKIFNTDVTLAGSWSLENWKPEWFGAKGDGATDDTVAINKCLQHAPENSVIVFNAPKYIVSSTINIPRDHIKLCGKSTIFASNNNRGENVINSNSRNFTIIEGLIIDVNGSAREYDGRTQPYRGISLTGDNIRIENVTVKNTLGASGNSAVCIGVAGNNNVVITCQCLDAGLAGKVSDGIYIGGQNNIISNCFGLRCTDTAFVLENTSRSIISGCVSDSSGATAAITCFAPYTYEGNIINGLTARNWNAVNTGGIAIGCIGSDSADCKLINTSINNVVMEADTTNGFGTGSAIYVRGNGNATVGEISISNCTIIGASKYGIEIAGTVNKRTLISNCNIKSNGGERCIDTKGNNVFIQGCFLNGSTIGVSIGAGVCNLRNNVIFGASAWAVWVYSGTLNSIMNELSTQGAGNIGHDSGATVNHLDHINNGVASLNIDNNAPTGTPTKKYPVWDTNGTSIIGYIPIYDQ